MLRGVCWRLAVQFQEKLTKQEVDHVVRVVRALVKKAKARYEVTMAMIKKKAKIKVKGILTDRTCLRAEQRRGHWGDGGKGKKHEATRNGTPCEF